MIIKDKTLLSKKCESVTPEEGEEIAIKLLKTLKETKNAIGLSANQIGIQKRVCVINVTEPIVLVNPRITKHSQETYISNEACLSFPRKTAAVNRFIDITVEADNFDRELHYNARGGEKDYLECACVQHEIDHLNGVTMMDRKIKGKTYKREGKKIGRNDKVLIASGVESKVMKYKKAQPLLEKGWVIVESK